MFNNWNQLLDSIKNTLAIIDSMSHESGYRDFKEVVENSGLYYLFEYPSNDPRLHSHNHYAIDALKEVFEKKENWSSILILISHLKNPEFIISKIVNKKSPCADVLNHARICIINYHIPREFSEQYFERFKITELDMFKFHSSDSPEIIGRHLSYYNELLPAIIPNDVKISLYILAEYDCETLYNVLSSSTSIIKTYCLSSCISLEKAIELIITSSTEHVSKTLAFYIINNTNINKNNVKISSNYLLELFQALYRKGDFDYWMKYINSYPCRFPRIQPDLGKALALINTPEVLDSYLNSIILHNNSLDYSYTNSREPVAQCLTVFKQYSTLALQSLCWEKAFTAWCKWDFGSSNNDLLFSVSSSELDYPVTQYFLNNITEKEREQFINKTWEKLSSIDIIWHASKSEQVSYYYRCASTLQLPFHANLAYEKNDSRMDLSLRFNLEISKYHQMLFGA
ncbi:hypothetical protein SD961_14220 [Erwinia sp. MMLR14_017]|uniref:hypothetical protein n=1 Tax=Erwinia sp. MMLR14_017 TaxID=3093842 RepID=UPI00298FD45B|nr:hypothetical protein [Erwinia sp. MMLR14_017]MDW8847026.1 hypothetical protein [Erwinia sp. MMLR14_017]